jgi:heterodisulfide reductase subunit B
MKEMFLYTGCTTPVRLPAYEAATKVILENLGIHLVDMKDANCCGAQYIESISRNAFAAMSGRILALGERYGLDILTICGACSGSLKHNKHLLDTDENLRDEVNSLLADEDLEYNGKIEVKHLLQVLNEDIGYQKIKEKIVKPYSNIKLAAHYGCHVTRPYEITQVDDPETPTIIDNIIETAGGIPVDYAGKTRCCGGPMLAMDVDLANIIGMEKINNVRAAGAEGIVTACVFCDIQLTQVQFGGNLAPELRVPVLTLPQFLGAAMGLDEDVLGIELNKISPERILSYLQEVRH